MSQRLIHRICTSFTFLWLVAGQPAARAEKKEPEPKLLTPSQLEGVLSARNDLLPEVSACTEHISYRRFGRNPPAWAKTQRKEGESLWDIGEEDYDRWAGILQSGSLLPALSYLSAPAAWKYAPQVKELLRREDPEVVSAAIETLDAMGVTDYAPELRKLLKSKIARVRGEAAEKLYLLGDAGAWEDICNWLSDAESNWEEGHVSLPAEAFKYEQIERIVRLFSHPDAKVRIRALRFLPENASFQHSDALVALLTPDQPEEVIFTVLEFHLNAAFTEIVDHLPALLRGGSQEVISRVLNRLEYPRDTEAVSAVAAFLTEEPPDWTTAAALNTLGRLRAGRYAATAGRFLSGEYPERVRVAAIEALSEMGAGAASWCADLGSMLENPGVERPLPLSELAALDRMHAVSQSGAIQRAMEKSNNRYFRMRCAMVLFHFGALSLREASRIAGETMRSPEFWLEYQTAGIQEAAKELLREGALDVVENALYSLGMPNQLNYWSVHGILASCSWLESSGISQFLKSPESAVRAGALEYLKRGGNFEFPELVEPLLAREEPPWVRAEALLYLRKADRTAAWRHVPGMLAPNEPLQVQSAALDALQGSTDPKIAPLLTDFLSPRKEQNFRQAAISILGNINAPGTAALLKPLLTKEESWWIRKYVFETLRQINVLEAAPVISSILADGDLVMRGEACPYFIAMSNGQNPAEVQSLLNDAEPGVRRAAIGQLEEIPELAARYRREIETLLTRPEPESRIAGIHLLSSAGFKDSLPAARRLLIDPNYEVVLQMTGALAEMEQPAATDLYPLFIEASGLHPGQRADILYTAHLLYASNAEVRRLLHWLGNRTASERPGLPGDAPAARELIEHLCRFVTATRIQRCPRATFEAGVLAANIVANTHWNFSDADWLFSLAREIQQYPDLEMKAATIRAVAQREYDRHPLRVAQRWGIIALALQPVLWLLVILLYPYWSFAQSLVWRPAVRRIAGLGRVGPLLVCVPFLRARLWRPFREALVPPLEVQTFDEWTFFDAVRIRRAASGGDSQPALSTLQNFQGVAVLQGVSGLGKTTLLQALVASASAPVAFLRATECREGILTALRHRLPEHAGQDAGFLRSLVRRGSPALFVDAVHEAPPAVQAQVTQEINALHGGRFLLTAQPVAWHPPENVATWEIEPLRPQDIAPFLLKQGSAALEAAGSHALPEKWKAFTAHVGSFLDALKAFPPEDPRAEAMHRMLRNPMEAVLAAELLAGGEIPKPSRLLAQRMHHLMEDYAARHGAPFPSTAFAEHLLTARLTGAPSISMDGFEEIAVFLAKHRLLRKIDGDNDGWRFRHDKIMDRFLAPAFADAADPVRTRLREDVRFAGVGAVEG